MCVCVRESDIVHRVTSSGVNETELLDPRLLGNRKVLLSEELNKEENPFCCCHRHKAREQQTFQEGRRQKCFYKHSRTGNVCMYMMILFFLFCFNQAVIF